MRKANSDRDSWKNRAAVKQRDCIDIRCFSSRFVQLEKTTPIFQLFIGPK